VALEDAVNDLGEPDRQSKFLPYTRAVK